MLLDKNSVLYRKCKVLGVCALSLIATSIVLSPIEKPVWAMVQEKQPEFNTGVEEALGQGILVGLLGGFRSITADFLWIRSVVYWRKRNLPATETFINMCTRIEPRLPYFWFQGAHMIAFDMPHWRIVQKNKEEKREMTKEERDVIRAEQGMKALELLDIGRQFHPDNPHFVLKKALIYYHVVEDQLKAAELYRKAALMEGAPFHAGRIHGEILRRHGMNKEAYIWYRSYVTTLPVENPYANFGLVVERIRELEETLKVRPEAALKLEDLGVYVK